MSIKQTENTNNYLIPFISMVILFFIVGFLTTANTQFQAPLKATFLADVGSMKNTLATLITFSWFLAYPIGGPIGSRWVNRSGYKATLVRGLGVMILGLGLFWLSSVVTVRYPDIVYQWADNRLPVGFFIFLFGSFTVGASAAILQVVINPYLVACLVKNTQAVQRMAIGGTANSIGTTVAPYFVSGIVFGGLSVDEIAVSQLAFPFLILMAVVVVLVVLLLYLPLPDIEEAHATRGETLERSVWSFRHLTLGVIAIFFYVGCEVCIGGNLNLYVLSDLQGSIVTATLMATLYWGGLLVGRLISSMLNKISPRTQLVFTTVMATIFLFIAMWTNNPWLLVAVGLFHSIMWGCIYTLAVTGLGKYTSIASGVFMIGVVGGAVLPLVQGFIADILGSWRWSWLIVLLGELVMLSYAVIGSRIHSHRAA
jgi:FHS family L-fucose permease-like MFS transporter